MKLNKKGFTLVELLVTIVIVGLVIGLSTFGIINLIKNSKDKTIVLSENNLKEAARIYSAESSSDSWKKNENFDAFCVTIGELMNKGLLDKKAKINGKLTKDDFIIVKRDKVSLAVENEEIVTNDIGEINNTICTGQVNNNEETTAPRMGSSSSSTDRIEINFTSGTATSGIKNYKCLYGESSSNINREGTISGNKCILNNLENYKDYYVFLYMNTTNGSSILATGNRGFKTKDFVSQTINQNKNKVTITYNDTNIYNNNASHYFTSTVEGTTNTSVEECRFKNSKLTCSGTTTTNIESNKWYKVSGNSIDITYAEENNDIDVTARIEDSSNNYREDTKNIKVRKYTVKFYKNRASSIDGKTDTYIERYCITDASSSCTITSPSITAPNGYNVVGFNQSSTGTTSTWNVNISKQINSDLTYYAIINPITYNITYNLNGGTVTGNPSTYTIESNDITLINPTKTGHTFTGWTGSNGSTKQTTVKIPKGSTGNKSYTANWTENTITTINGNRFLCESTNRLAVYYITTCNETTCSYTTKNGLDSNYSFGNDVIGYPIWAIENAYLVDNISNKSSITTNGYTCSRSLQYITASYLNCRKSATTIDPYGNNIDNVVNGWERCTPINVYRTTMKFDSENNWWYSSTYNCYLSGTYLTTSKPSSCYSSDGDGGNGENNNNNNDCTTGKCKCQEKCGGSSNYCYQDPWCYCCTDSNTPCTVNGGKETCKAYLM